MHDRPRGGADGRGSELFKIEGRAKSAYYAAIVTGAYRHAIDAAAQGIPLDPVWRDEVEKVSHRHYSTGFYYGYPGRSTRTPAIYRDWQVAAIVQDCTPDGSPPCPCAINSRQEMKWSW